MVIEREKHSRSQEGREAKRHESDFRVAARRNKLLGLWATASMGLSGEAAETYAKEVIRADLEEEGHEDVICKVLGDFTAKKVDIGRDEVIARLNELEDEARRQLADG